MKNKDRKQKWRVFFQNWKKIWRNPDISPYTKLTLFNVFLYRSDEKGWRISERELASDLGIGKQTASDAIDDAIKRKWLTASNGKERKRRKLRLSGSLRSPVWASLKPRNWAPTKPSKYQSKYQSNNSSKKEERKREGKMTKALSQKEGRKRIREIKELLKGK